MPHSTTTHFRTGTGIHVPAVTADQMREVDRIAVEENGPSLLQMMENAGRSLAALAMHLLGDHWRRSRIVVLAGSGGNGGGGICAARHLANRSVDVAVCLAEPERLTAASSFQRRIFRTTAGREFNDLRHLTQSPDLILDGLIGYGLKGAPTGKTADLIEWANETGVPILALDVPSGINATDGNAPSIFVKPKWTLTLALPKTGLSKENSGELFLADLGIPESVYRQVGLSYSCPFGNSFCLPLEVVDDHST